MSENAEIQSKLCKIQTKLKAHKGQDNDFGGFKYRSCEDILEAVKPLLLENELVLTISDELVLIGERYYVKAKASLTDGKRDMTVTAYAREALHKKGMDEAQITGAASSYARKYALNGLFCIDDTKDADTQDNREQGKKEEKKTDTYSEDVKAGEKLHQKTIKDMVVEKGKKVVPKPEDFVVWRVDQGFSDKLSDCSDFDLTKMLMKLKDLQSMEASVS